MPSRKVQPRSREKGPLSKRAEPPAAELAAVEPEFRPPLWVGPSVGACTSARSRVWRVAHPPRSSQHGPHLAEARADQNQRLNRAPQRRHPRRHPQKVCVVERGEGVADDGGGEERAELAEGDEHDRAEEREAEVAGGEGGDAEETHREEDEAVEEERPEEREGPDRVGVVQAASRGGEGVRLRVRAGYVSGTEDSWVIAYYFGAPNGGYSPGQVGS